jgi:zinc transport system substrate-binding protein
MGQRIFFVFFCVLVAACAKKTPVEARKPLLLVSLAPYQTLVQTIAGNEFEVQTIVPNGADPHHYEPTAQQLIQASQGKIWFRIGESFEAKLLPLLKNARLVDLRDTLPLIEGQCKHHQDRHLWLSPKLLAIQAEHVTAALSATFPERQEKFEERLAILIRDLKTLDLEIESQLSSAKVRTFLVSHPAFAYFCRDYDCSQLSIEHEGKEPRPK